jgi:hypothetical protein
MLCSLSQRQDLARPAFAGAAPRRATVITMTITGSLAGGG